MRHVIAHLVRGEAKEAHEAITKNLATKFDSFPLHERIPPHLTLKRWFDLDADSMAVLHHALDDFAASHQQTDYELKGFGHFGGDVIYVDVLPSEALSTDVLELMGVLHKIPNLTFDEFDNGKEFHATVAMGALKPFNFDEIWNYLQTIEQPDFKMKFDNIAILKKPVQEWVVDCIWELNPES